MGDGNASGSVLNALVRGLAAQGQTGHADPAQGHLTSFPIQGTINLVALADALENALGGGTSDDEEAKTPAELNAANDG